MHLYVSRGLSWIYMRKILRLRVIKKPHVLFVWHSWEVQRRRHRHWATHHYRAQPSGEATGQHGRVSTQPPQLAIIFSTKFLAFQLRLPWAPLQSGQESASQGTREPVDFDSYQDGPQWEASQRRCPTDSPAWRWEVRGRLPRREESHHRWRQTRTSAR